jgi:hypothetical protein
MTTARVALLAITISVLASACGARSTTPGPKANAPDGGGGSGGAGGGSTATTTSSGGGAGGAPAIVACPPGDSVAETQADGIAGKPCGESGTCHINGFCDSCSVECVNGVWQMPSCVQAGPTC